MKLHKYLPPEAARRFFEAPKLRFTPPLDFNDPFEFRPYLTSTGAGGWNLLERLGWSKKVVSHNDDQLGLMWSFLKNLNLRFGLSCFSSDPANLLMWSHYAAGHTGIVVSFDGSHEFFADKRILPIRYSNSRPVVSIKELVSTGFNFLRYEWPGWTYFLDNRPEIVSTKAECWAYEKEVRVLREFAADPQRTLPFADGSRRASVDLADQLTEVPPQAIRSIILGAKHQTSNSLEGFALFSDSNFGLEDEIRMRMQLHGQMGHVKFLRAHADFREYKLDIFDPTNSWTAAKYLPPIELELYKSGEKGPIPDHLMKIVAEHVAARGWPRL